MTIIKNAFIILFKRPFILVFTSFIILIINLICYNVAKENLLSNFFSETGSLYEKNIYLINAIFNSDKLIDYILVSLLALIIFSALISLILSCFFNTIHKTLIGKSKGKKDYFDGISISYMRIFLITLFILLVLLIIFLLSLFASIPVLAINSISNSISAFGAYFISAITFISIYFVITMIRVYAFCQYPALFYKNTKSILSNKKIIDFNFWKIFFLILLSDIIYVIIFLSFKDFTENSTSFIIMWLLLTVFSSYFFTFMFALFKMLRYKYIIDINKRKKRIFKKGELM